MIGLLRPAPGGADRGRRHLARRRGAAARIQQRFGVSFQAGALFGSLTLARHRPAARE